MEAREGWPRGGFGALGLNMAAEAREWALRHPVHDSRVISCAERRAGWVRKLHLQKNYKEPPQDFSPEHWGRLVAVAASSLTEI